MTNCANYDVGFLKSAAEWIEAKSSRCVCGCSVYIFPPYLICCFAQLCRLATYDPEIFKFDGDNAYVHYDEPRAGKPVCIFFL